MERLNKELIYNGFLTGAKAVISNEEHLNLINVFPIKDNDTGSNLASLMNEILTKSTLEHTLKDTLNSISNAALIGSKGNSGLIFSQFFYGLSIDVNDDELDLEKLVLSLENGYNYAYESIENPVEGTIITLMRKWVLTLKSFLPHKTDIKESLMSSNKALKKALKQTKDELLVLKKNDVVDAGAKAFTIFVDGFVNSVTNNEEKIKQLKPIIKNDLDHKQFSNLDEITNRYCTEVLIKTNLDKFAINSLVKKFGNSLVIGKSSNYYKIHIHTNDPSGFVSEVKNFAAIYETKIEDMVNQYNLNNKKQAKIGIITDSIADLPREITENNNIQVLPISIKAGDMYYFDGLTVNNNTIIEIVNSSNELPKTASPNLVSVIEMLKNLKKYYEKLIILTVSSKMSSTYNVFNTAVKRLDSKDIVIIDTLQNSTAQGLLVLKASKLALEDESFLNIIDKIKASIKRTKILVHVDSLDNMVKGGRIKKGLNIFAKIVRLKPIVSINEAGEGIVYKLSIGSKHNLKRILKHLKKVHNKEGIKTYAISHVNNLALAEKLKTEIIKQIKIKPAYITDTSSVIALNAGNKAVAVAYIRKD